MVSSTLAPVTQGTWRPSTLCGPRLVQLHLAYRKGQRCGQCVHRLSPDLPFVHINAIHKAWRSPA
jgi:hypothetical protein